MASIEKRISDLTGKTSYRAIVDVRGHKRQSKTFTRKTDATAWASNLEYELRELPHLSSTKASCRTLGEAIDKYLDTVQKHKAASTQQSVASAFDWWKENYGSYTLKEITPALLADAQDKIASRKIKKRDPETGEHFYVPISNARIVAIMMVISGVLTKAWKKWHWITTNPAMAVEKPTVDNARSRFLKTEPDEGEKLSEYVRLMEAVAISESTDLQLAVELAINTGGRKLEVLGLSWKAVDLKKGVIHFYITKNKEKRAVSIPVHLIDKLKERKRTQLRIDTTLVFPNKPKPGNPINPINLKSSWATARARANVLDFRWHDLRHTAGSYLAMSGCSLLEIADVLGHKDLQMVRRYAHLSPDHVATVSTKIGQFIEAANE